jgi:very-short-patch-repair endonuclease
MKCVHHPTEIAVIICDFCGAGLCKDCKEASEVIITKRCEICDRQFNNINVTTVDGQMWCRSCSMNKKEMDALIKNIKKQQPEKEITLEQQKLYLALKALNWEMELEYKDGHKTVDIAILSANLFIEVNGSHHANNSNQLRSDLWRIHSSLKDGFLTLPVFNEALNGTEFHQTVSVINDIAKERNG